MDKVKTNYIPVILFEHMKIGMILYTCSIVLTFDQIQNIAEDMKISECSLRLALKDLVLRGIISANFEDDHKLVYTITDFGRYFYNKLCLSNNDAAKLCEAISGET